MTRRDWADIRWAVAVMLWGIAALIVAGGVLG